MNEENNKVILNANNISVSFGGEQILKNTNISIYENEKIGLIGRNGSGKSTLLKIISELEPSSSGEISRKKGLTLSYLPQICVFNDDATIYQSILEGASYITKLINIYETLPSSSEKAHILEQEISSLDGWNLDNEINKLIHILNIPDKEKKIQNLSGGEKRRIGLARAIISHPELLILDEPTNHLDTDAIQWLEEYISSYKGTIIFVTHDRYFLDNLSTRIVELSNSKIYSYGGTYSDYLVEKAKRIEVEEKAENKRQSFIRKEIEWIRRMPKARTTKSYSRVERFNQAVSQLPPEKEIDIELIIPPARTLSDKVIEMQNVSFMYEDKKILSNFDFLMTSGMKIGIVGKNGAGKTTFLKLLMKKLHQTEGTVEIASNVEFNYIDQNRITLNENNSVYEEISAGHDFINLGQEKISIWAYLQRFLFDDDRIKTKISSLSGGEKGRLMLAKILKNGGNFIILDEPTNDLDIQTMNILEDALLSFRGCVMIVSHDRYFLNRICSHTLAFEDNSLKLFVGNYSYYCEKRNNNFCKNIEEKQQVKPEGKVLHSIDNSKKLTWKEERELETLESKVIELEEQIEDIESAFCDSNFFQKHGNTSTSLKRELDEKREELNKIYLRWNELEKKKEKIN